MTTFLADPAALEFVAGQAWLSPSEAVSTRTPSYRPRPLGASDALRQIVAIIARVDLLPRRRRSSRALR